MKNLSKREKVVLLLVAVALFYAAFEFFPRNTPEDSPERNAVSRQDALQEADKLVVQLAETLKEAELSLSDAYIIERAGESWVRDPFFIGMTVSAGIVDHDDGQIKPEISFLYTGYVEVGNSRIAIINGVDYRVGEEMEVPGHFVQSLSPRQAVIVDRQGRTTIVPFVEE